MKNPNSISSVYPKASTENLVVQQLSGETLIYNLTTNRAFCLNPTAADVWNCCNGRTSVAEMAQSLSRQNKRTVTEEVVWLALAQLQEKNLIVKNEEVSAYFKSIPRRTLIKQIGLAAVIALPVVSSIVAPEAAQAQSGTGSGACTDNCTTIGSVCTCMTGSINCPPQTTVGVTVGAGLCATAAAAATLGITVTAGGSGNVCLVAAACV